MEDLFNSVSSSHKGISFATIILFGAFIFLIIQTQLSFAGRITNVLRKTGFFAMLLLYVQGALGFFLAIYSPDFQGVSGFGNLLSHFKYTICILTCAGVMTYVHSFLNKNDKLTLRIVIITLASALLFEYAYPWRELLGF